MDYIYIKGARENNLKNIELKIPKNKLIVMTGVSGSGKSSLAFDTIYQEGERRFVESLSTYARQFIGMQDKPDVDIIEGLSPSISIDQKTASHNPRSTVGTVTEIYDYLRVLFARIGTPYCPHHHLPISSWSIDEIISKIMELNRDTRVYILAPVVREQKGEHKQLLQNFLKQGYVRAYIDGELVELDNEIKLEKNKKHTIDLVVDRLKLKDDSLSRLTEAISLAFKASSGFVKVMYDDKVDLYSENYACPLCGFTLPELEPRLFSFNNPLGACPDCHGLGYKLHIDKNLIIDEEKSLVDGAIVPYRNQEKDNLNFAELAQVCAYYGIDDNIPFKNLEKNKQDIILYGSPDIIHFRLVSTSGRESIKNKKFEGIINTFERRYLETNSDWIREWIEGYMVESECQTCHEKTLLIYVKCQLLIYMIFSLI